MQVHFFAFFCTVCICSMHILRALTHIWPSSDAGHMARSSRARPIHSSAEGTGSAKLTGPPSPVFFWNPPPGQAGTPAQRDQTPPGGGLRRAKSNGKAAHCIQTLRDEPTLRDLRRALKTPGPEESARRWPVPSLPPRTRTCSTRSPPWFRGVHRRGPGAWRGGCFAVVVTQSARVHICICTYICAYVHMYVHMYMSVDKCAGVSEGAKYKVQSCAPPRFSPVRHTLSAAPPPLPQRAGRLQRVPLHVRPDWQRQDFHDGRPP